MALLWTNREIAALRSRFSSGYLELLQHPHQQTSAAAITTLILIAGGLLYWLRKPRPRANYTPSTKPSSTSSKPCRFPLDDDTSATITLPDGRKMGYAEYGSPTGRPIFSLHGFPGSRFEAAYFHDDAKALNARIISVERPGIGWSSAHPGRSLTDHAQDIQYLADNLGLREFGIHGPSGGGPYALACAASMPADKLKAVSVVCGLGSPDMSNKGMNWVHYAGLRYAFRYCPSIIRSIVSREAGARYDLDENSRFELVKQQFCNAKGHPNDVDFWNNNEMVDDAIRVYLRTCAANREQGYDGFLQDGNLICSPWVFRIEDIRPDLRLQLRYGNFDSNVPPVHGRETAARFRGNADLKVWDETHVGVFFNKRREVLEDLLAAMGD